MHSSSSSRTTTTTMLIATGVLASLVACSGSSGGSSASTAGAAPKGAASAIANAVGPGSSIADLTSKACAAIKPADAQALLKKQGVTARTNPFECAWDGGALTVTIYPNDTSDKYYGDQTTHLEDPGTLPIGDKAVWFQPVPGHTVPAVVAKKGTNTCEVQLSADPPDTTMPYTGSMPIVTTKRADVAAYAAKMGVLCSEVFGALG
jgi:hypothetical protein